MGGTGARRPGIGLGIASTVTVALPALTANLALELAPVRVNLIAALAGHLMSDTALTGATYDIDGGQQLIAPSEKRPA